VQAITLPRVHTSFVLVPDGEHLQSAIALAEAQNVPSLAELALFHPFVYVHEGKRYFQDTLGGLSPVVGVGHFETRHTECYDHLHNGTLIDLVAERHPLGDAMQARVGQAFIDPATIRNSWAGYDQYYRERRVN